ncbi:MAG: PSD1 and planctomycete cytochrome C domain-containing protein [Planctomycetota bacterium]
MNFKSRLSSIRLARSWNSGTGRPNRKWGAPARWTLWSLGYFVVFSTSLSAADEKTDFFETRIRPLIVEHCLECHGDEGPEANLRLTSREHLLAPAESGQSALNLDQPAASQLLSALRYDGELQMPPAGKLSDEEIAAFEKWVLDGAPWPATAAPVRASGLVISAADRAHWSFRPVESPAVPTVAEADWVRTPIDAFVLAKLEQAGLQPSPAADRRTLLRRLTYDLTGLPPTNEELAAFLADESPHAYEQAVERLLASPRYGERWGRHWLDIARYADTKDGVLMFGADRMRPFAYTYRDYVIRALNEDIPYDQFIREQLAADLIQPSVEPWRLGALGFLTLGRMFDNNVHDIIDDQIDTTTRGFLGLTISCARCHDHKFDPVPITDYYSLHGVFANCEVPMELPLIEDPNATEAGRKFEEEIRAKREELRNFVDQQHALQTEDARQRVGAYLAHALSTPPDPMETAVFFRSLTPDDFRPQITVRWRKLLAARLRLDDPVFGPAADFLQQSAAATSDANGAPGGGPNHKAEGELAAGELWPQILESWASRPAGTAAGEVNPLLLEQLRSSQVSTPAELGQAYGAAILAVYRQTLPSEPAAAAATTEPGAATEPAVASSAAADSPEFKQLLELLVGPANPTWFPKSQTHRYTSRGETDAYHGKVVELDRLAAQNPAAPARAMVVRDSEQPYAPRVFLRGNPTNFGAEVPRQFVSILAPERSPFGAGSGRLDLAASIASPGNPLTARVIVNRIWMGHFVEPLVSTPSDFGLRSERPLHAELLDYLAAELPRHGWSLKWLHRELVLSNTYRQASQVEPSTAERASAIDPENRLFWRMNRRRLEVEALRDTLLSVSGKLNLQMYGRPEAGAAAPDSTRRTVYGLVDRQGLPVLFRNFDFASPDQSIERRPQTVVPQQALFALNSPFMIARSGDLATQVLAQTGTATERITWLYQRVLQRPPTEVEQAACAEFLADVAPEAEPSRWSQLAQVLLASNELLYVD